MRKICVVTGTRAEYGLLSRLMRIVKGGNQTRLQVIATNMHLSPQYGYTCQEIENDGFTIDKKIPILEDGKDDANATVNAMARALVGFSAAYLELKPDIVVVLGDRFEIMAAVMAAHISRIPIAHIHGGEITEGAYDDAIRHCITKMSHLHFTSTETYRNRVIQLGEQPDRVFCVGALGVENIKKLPLMERGEIESSLGIIIDEKTILVTYHPVTLGEHSATEDINVLLQVLEEWPDLRIIFTMPNSDTGASAIAQAIHSFVTRHPERASSFKSLGILRYLSVMKYSGAVVGNSSSGILEAPSLGIPSLNIGDRQKGRVAADSVCNCDVDRMSISKGLGTVLSPAFKTLAREVKNPYEKEGTAQAIYDILCNYPLEQLHQKHFHDIQI